MTTWVDGADLDIEGQPYPGLDQPFTRLPGWAEDIVPEPVWAMSRCAAGLAVRFTTDAPLVGVHWKATSFLPESDYFAETGVSGVDLYRREGHRSPWRHVGVGRPGSSGTSCARFAVPPAEAEYRLYLPLYARLESLAVGARGGSGIHSERPRPRLPRLCMYGSSIVQGGCASRAGMAHAALIGRALGVEVVNLGFSGSARMELEVADLIADVDAELYVVDALPNMDAALVEERAEPFLRRLAARRPHSPVLLVNELEYPGATLDAATTEDRGRCFAAQTEAAARVTSEGIGGVSVWDCRHALGDDGDGTVDGVHPTDLGFARLGNALLYPLREALETDVDFRVL